MRGYGDSDKPPGVENYAMDLLVNDVKQVVEALGSYSNQFLANCISVKEIRDLKSSVRDNILILPNSGLSIVNSSNCRLIHNCKIQIVLSIPTPKSYLLLVCWRK
jgi:hypothetical protein